MDLYYVTGNSGKFNQVAIYLKHTAPHINLIQHDVDLHEIQTLDQEAIARDKATQAWNLLKKPLIIDDSGFYFEKYHQFPGTLSRYVFEGIGFEGLLKLVEPGDRMHGLVYLIYVDAEGDIVSFPAKTEGTVIFPKPNQLHPTLPYISIFKPDGADKSYFEMHGTAEEGKYSQRLKAVQQLVDWLMESGPNH